MRAAFDGFVRFAAIAIAACLITIAPAYAQARYDVSQLHPDVRAAVERARAAEAQGNAAGERARGLIAGAQDAANRARRGQSGYRAYNYDNDEPARRYEGGWSTTRHDLGVLSWSGGDYAGDRYEGRFNNGEFGNGVYTWATNANNPNDAGAVDRYEGEFIDDAAGGSGIYYWRDGRRYAGGFSNWWKHGYGVMNFTSGNRYEGAWSEDRRTGYGVLWGPDGQVMQAGVWSNDQLASALSRQATQADINQGDDAAWAAAQRANTISSYDAYLGNFPSGRHAREARTARQAIVAAMPAAFDLAQLHPNVRAAVIEARRSESLGDAAGARGREAGQRGRQSGRINPQSGYGVHNGANQFAGDQFAGSYAGGQFNGSGTYTWSNNANNQQDLDRYEGDWANDRRHGFGVQYWRDGSRYVGAWGNGTKAGTGVYHYADGDRNEGEWANGELNGYGVRWDGQGRLLEQGIYSANRLTTPLTGQ